MRMRFETRAMVGYGVLLVLLVGGMVLSIRRLAAVSTDQITRLHGEEREITLVDRLRWNGELIASNGRGYLLSAEEPMLERTIAASRRFDDTLRALRTGSLSPDDAVLLADIERAAAAFQRVQEQLLAERRLSNGAGELLERYEEKLLPLGAELDRSLEALVIHKEVALRRAYDDAESRRDSVVLWLYGLLALLAVIGVLVAAFFSRLLGRAYRQESEAHETANRAVAARDQLMGMVAHDLRNPLGAILMKAELLRSGAGDPAKLRKHAESIHGVAQRMEHLIKSMLDAATLEAGRFTVTPDPQPVAGILRDATEMFAAQAAAKHIALECRGDEASVSADRERVVQVLSNLVGNALKFTPSGGKITVSAAPEPETVHFTVADSGPGIPADDVAHVFDRFWKRETGGQKGTGLGLFIAKGIVEAHGGHIWVDNAPAGGARFHFTLPLA